MQIYAQRGRDILFSLLSKVKPRKMRERARKKHNNKKYKNETNQRKEHKIHCRHRAYFCTCK